MVSIQYNVENISKNVKNIGTQQSQITSEALSSNIFDKSFMQQSLTSINKTDINTQSNSKAKTGTENKTDTNATSPNDSFVNKITQKIKEHPILTAVTLFAATIGGLYLANYLINTKAANKVLDLQNIQTNIKPITPQKPIIPEPDFSDMEVVRKTIEEGVEYEKSIGFKNLEIFKDIPDEKVKKILWYFEYSKKEKDLLLFASGNKPGLIEGNVCNGIEVFGPLKNDKVGVVQFLFDKPKITQMASEDHNYILNIEETRKVLEKYKEFFITRLEMPETSSTDDLLKEVMKSIRGKLQLKKQYADLRHILTGGEFYDALHRQMVIDKQQNVFDIFFPGCAKSLEEYKVILKDIVLDSRYTYSKMSDKFKEDLLKKIDTLSQKSFDNIISEPVRIFNDAAYDAEQKKALTNLARKLYMAKQYGAKINL